MPKIGCLNLTQEQAGRRDFLKAGSLGLLGIHLRQFLAVQTALAASVNKSKSKAQACILLWPESHRYLGPEAEQQFQADFHQRRGHSDL